MPLEAQAKILRTLETRTVSPVGSDKEQPVNVVVVAASNRDLTRLVTEGKFRQDLLYRLNVVSYYLPPLHDRPDDIPLLASHFLRRFAEDAGTAIKQLAGDAVALLRSHPFPGNVREFKNLMERVNIYVDSPEIRAEHLRSLLPESAVAPEVSLKEAVDNFERNHILKTLHSNRGNVARTARQLKLERSHLYKKMKRHGLD